MTFSYHKTGMWLTTNCKNRFWVLDFTTEINFYLLIQLSETISLSKESMGEFSWHSKHFWAIYTFWSSKVFFLKNQPSFYQLPCAYWFFPTVCWLCLFLLKSKLEIFQKTSQCFLCCLLVFMNSFVSVCWLSYKTWAQDSKLFRCKKNVCPKKPSW